MKPQPIWISSIEHLDKFSHIAGGSNFFQKLFGYYKIPAGFPYIQIMKIFRMPIVFFGSSEINITQNEILFTPLTYKTFGSNYINTKQKDFRLNKSDIKSIERYEPSPILMKYFTINWVRIKTKPEILGGDFLICVSGSGPSMDKIQKSTNDLYDELITFTN